MSKNICQRLLMTLDSEDSFIHQHNYDQVTHNAVPPKEDNEDEDQEILHKRLNISNKLKNTTSNEELCEISCIRIKCRLQPKKKYPPLGQNPEPTQPRKAEKF